MKNSDMPAMPIENINLATSIANDGGNAFAGLTKREMFAMHAPDCPSWFEKEFHMSHMENKDYFRLSYDEFSPMIPTLKGGMALIKAWRYAYADLMLGG